MQTPAMIYVPLVLSCSLWIGLDQRGIYELLYLTLFKLGLYKCYLPLSGLYFLYFSYDDFYPHGGSGFY